MRLRSVFWAALVAVVMLGEFAVRRPHSEEAAHLVGSEACADCHEK